MSNEWSEGMAASCRQRACGMSSSPAPSGRSLPLHIRRNRPDQFVAPGDTPSISGDGRFVAFTSSATNLVAGMPAGQTGNIFVRDLQAQTTTLISSAAGGTAGGDSDSYSPVISRDGS